MKYGDVKKLVTLGSVNKITDRYNELVDKAEARYQEWLRDPPRDMFQAVGFFRVQSGPTQAVLPLVGLAAEKVNRDRYKRNPAEYAAELSVPFRNGQQMLPLRQGLHEVV